VPLLDRPVKQLGLVPVGRLKADQHQEVGTGHLGPGIDL
jgi:hypothetical protein